MIARKWLAVSVGLASVLVLAGVAFFTFGHNDEARFVRAVQDGDINTVSAMLSKNSELARVERPQKVGTTPVLYIAISRDYKEIVRLLLSNGADPKSYPRALRYANDTEIAELLIQHGANVNWQDENSSIPTALHFFAAIDNTELAELLINHGAEVNAKDRAGETPLHEAAREGRLNAAKLLILKGADINANSKENKTPFDQAVMPVWNEDAYRLEQERIRRCKEVAAYLLACGSTATIFDLAWLGDMQRVAAILKSTPSLVNERANGEPLLFAAIRGGNAEVVEHLLKNGAQLRVTGRHQQTPLQVAAYIGYEDVVQVLLNHGVDVDERGPWGETALHWAAVKGNTDVAALLLEKGADANSQTSSHTIDLNERMRDDADPVELELKRFKIHREQEIARKLGIGLQVMGVAKLAFTTGDTPTHAATYWNHADLVRLLIANGADINRANCWGATPLHYGVVCRYHDIAKMLLDNGANPKANTHKMTPVEIARKVKDRKLVSLLARGKPTSS
jgi:ankyrin repeat protein